MTMPTHSLELWSQMQKTWFMRFESAELPGNEVIVATESLICWLDGIPQILGLMRFDYWMNISREFVYGVNVRKEGYRFQMSKALHPIGRPPLT